MNGISQTTIVQTLATYQTNQTVKSDTAKKDVKEPAVSSSDGKKEVKGPGTYGDPKLSDKALNYYNNLKKKYGNLNFVLVASDKKQQAEMMKGSFASAGGLTVLIDTDKLERMATDEKYREQIEGTIRNAAYNIKQLSSEINKSSASSSITSFGMTINEKGTASFFAVIDKSLIAQKERIEKNAIKKKEEKKQEDKKTAKREAQEKLEELRNEKESSKTGESDKIVITADSIDELLKKVEQYEMNYLTEQARTETERSVGQTFDFSI